MLSEREKEIHKAENKRERDRTRAERNYAMHGWIKANGSEHLKRCIAEGVECRALWRQEWLAWHAGETGLADLSPQWEGNCLGRPDEPRNPPQHAWDLLDRVRKTMPWGELMWWQVPHRHSKNCPAFCSVRSDWSGYVIVGRVLEKTVVFGLPKQFHRTYTS